VVDLEGHHPMLLVGTVKRIVVVLRVLEQHSIESKKSAANLIWVKNTGKSTNFAHDEEGHVSTLPLLHSYTNFFLVG
jgi:hypothetical protein